MKPTTLHNSYLVTRTKIDSNLQNVHIEDRICYYRLYNVIRAREINRQRKLVGRNESVGLGGAYMDR